MQERPWEAVALGQALPKKNHYQRYEAPTLRPDVKPGDEEAAEVAEYYNTRALQACSEWVLGVAEVVQSTTSAGLRRGMLVVSACVVSQSVRSIWTGALSVAARASQAFKKKEWQLCYDLASEAIRLNPRKVPYLGNRTPTRRPASTHA